MIVAAIEQGRLPAGARMPSSRELATILSVARNTVVLAYQQLVDEGFLESRERSGYFVGAAFQPQTRLPGHLSPGGSHAGSPAWDGRFTMTPSTRRNIVKPKEWLRYQFSMANSIPASFQRMIGGNARAAR
jgi:GntR family transcriptional regulator/MocR family aminotransferase